MAATTLLTKIEDGVMTITLNRPDVLNAFNGAANENYVVVLDQERYGLRLIDLTAGEQTFAVTAGAGSENAGEDLGIVTTDADGDHAIVGAALHGLAWSRSVALGSVGELETNASISLSRSLTLAPASRLVLSNQTLYPAKSVNHSWSFSTKEAFE